MPPQNRRIAGKAGRLSVMLDAAEVVPAWSGHLEPAGSQRRSNRIAGAGPAVDRELAGLMDGFAQIQIGPGFRLDVIMP